LAFTGAACDYDGEGLDPYGRSPKDAKLPVGVGRQSDDPGIVCNEPDCPQDNPPEPEDLNLFDGTERDCIIATTEYRC